MMIHNRRLVVMCSLALLFALMAVSVEGACWQWTGMNWVSASASKCSNDNNADAYVESAVKPPSYARPYSANPPGGAGGCLESPTAQGGSCTNYDSATGTQYEYWIPVDQDFSTTSAPSSTSTPSSTSSPTSSSTPMPAGDTCWRWNGRSWDAVNTNTCPYATNPNYYQGVFNPNRDNDDEMVIYPNTPEAEAQCDRDYPDTLCEETGGHYSPLPSSVPSSQEPSRYASYESCLAENPGATCMQPPGSDNYVVDTSDDSDFVVTSNDDTDYTPPTSCPSGYAAGTSASGNLRCTNDRSATSGHVIIYYPEGPATYTSSSEGDGPIVIVCENQLCYDKAPKNNPNIAIVCNPPLCSTGSSDERVAGGNDHGDVADNNDEENVPSGYSTAEECTTETGAICAEGTNGDFRPEGWSGNNQDACEQYTNEVCVKNDGDLWVPDDSSSSSSSSNFRDGEYETRQDCLNQNAGTAVCEYDSDSNRYHLVGFSDEGVCEAIYEEPCVLEDGRYVPDRVGDARDQDGPIEVVDRCPQGTALADGICMNVRRAEPLFLEPMKYLGRNRYLGLDYSEGLETFISETEQTPFWAQWWRGNTHAALVELACAVEEDLADPNNGGMLLSSSGQGFMSVEGEYFHIPEEEREYWYKFSFQVIPDGGTNCATEFRVTVDNIPLFRRGGAPASIVANGTMPAVWTPGSAEVPNRLPAWQIVTSAHPSPRQTICLEVVRGSHCWQQSGGTPAYGGIPLVGPSLAGGSSSPVTRICNNIVASPFAGGDSSGYRDPVTGQSAGSSGTGGSSGPAGITLGEI